MVLLLTTPKGRKLTKHSQESLRRHGFKKPWDKVDAIIDDATRIVTQADGATVTTVEGFADSGRSNALRAAFAERNALQCGYCTPGMMASALEYIEGGGAPDRDAIREHLSGNYCRCTGYQSIVAAICDVIEGRAGA